MKRIVFCISLLLVITSCCRNHTDSKAGEDMDTVSVIVTDPVVPHIVGGSKLTEKDKESYEKFMIIKSDNNNSLEFWTADSIFYSNPKFVRLIDILYQYVHNNFRRNDMQRNSKWMRNYTLRINNYYSESNREVCNPYQIADSVITEAKELWDTDDESTMSIVVNNSAKEAIMIYELFVNYFKLYDLCKTEKQKKILEDEFNSWMVLRNLFENIFCECADLEFWGGSISGIIKSKGCLNLWNSHIQLLKTNILWARLLPQSGLSMGLF